MNPINNGRFQIFLRRKQFQSQIPAGTGPVIDVVVQCNPINGYSEYVAGTVDNTTPFMGIIPVNGWYDFTNFIEGSEKFTFTWDKVNTGDSSNSTTNQDGSNYDKGLSSELMFFDSGYQFVFNWLANSECQILNSVEVKIIDLIARSGLPDPASNYRIFEIKNDNLEYAPIDEPCQFHIKLREQDNKWHCIHKTFIFDDWQGWFKSGLKDHPCFLTCIEPRPRLVSSARMAIMLFYHSNPLVTLITWITGQGDIEDNARKILNANRFVDSPLVGTYIQNAAGKCGLAYDTIFDPGQDWENLCLYFPSAGYMHESDENSVASPALTYHYDNRWLVTIAELLDKLKVVFAAEWYVTPNNTLIFKYKKDLINLAPIYDFTLSGAEPIYNLRYTFNGDKKPAYGRYEYQTDGSDLASQEISTLYNDIVDYDGPANNPMLEGERLKNFEFAPTGFIRDGRAKDYLKLLIDDGKLGALVLVGIFVVIGVIISGGLPFTTGSLIALGVQLFLWLGKIIIETTKLRNEFVNGPTYGGAVRLTSEQTLVPRLLLWDGVNEQRAKVVQDTVLPSPNLFYNPTSIPYDEKNKIDQDNPFRDIYNYDLYFDGDFWGNLFPSYHDVIDNPLKSLESHQDVRWDVDLCEGMLNLFGVFENQYAQIGKIVKLETRDNYDVYVRIGNISVNYDDNKINLRGTVIRRLPFGVQRPENVGRPYPLESGSIINDDDICFKWINDSDEPTENIIYRDCFGNLVGAEFSSEFSDEFAPSGVTIAPGGTFCAFEIISLGTGGNIVATDNCDPLESGNGSGVIPCYAWNNLGFEDATGVSYVDCDGNLITDATIITYSAFCAREITDYGCGGNILNIGLCNECIVCCDPVVLNVTIQN